MVQLLRHYAQKLNRLQYSDADKTELTTTYTTSTTLKIMIVPNTRLVTGIGAKFHKASNKHTHTGLKVRLCCGTCSFKFIAIGL